MHLFVTSARIPAERNRSFALIDPDFLYVTFLYFIPSTFDILLHWSWASVVRSEKYRTIFSWRGAIWILKSQITMFFVPFLSDQIVLYNGFVQSVAGRCKNRPECLVIRGRWTTIQWIGVQRSVSGGYPELTERRSSLSWRCSTYQTIRTAPSTISRSAMDIGSSRRH